LPQGPQQRIPPNALLRFRLKRHMADLFEIAVQRLAHNPCDAASLEIEESVDRWVSVETYSRGTGEDFLPFHCRLLEARYAATFLSR
jgi:hypothetical protein